MINQSIGRDSTWQQDGLVFSEQIAQAYTNCKLSAGTVHGHPVDTLYLRFERDGEEPVTYLFRPDEMAAIAWCASGVLWSRLVEQITEP